MKGHHYSLRVTLSEREYGNRTYLFDGSTNTSVVFTNRLGGSSGAPFDSLNLGLLTKDDRSNVEKNRKLVSEDLSISERWAHARQVHEAEAVQIGKADLTGARPRADALITKEIGLPVAVFAADCVPIALIGRDVVGAVHAGWRGLARGVIDSAVKMARPNGPAEPMTAVMGPSIGPCHYEVGPEVPERFRRRYPSAPEFSSQVRKKLHFDLWGAARWQLSRAGVSITQNDPPCTMCESRFYSYRREGETGRQALIVWMHGGEE